MFSTSLPLIWIIRSLGISSLNFAFSEKGNNRVMDNSCLPDFAIYIYVLYKNHLKIHSKLDLRLGHWELPRQHWSNIRLAMSDESEGTGKLPWCAWSGLACPDLANCFWYSIDSFIGRYTSSVRTAFSCLFPSASWSSRACGSWWLCVPQGPSSAASFSAGPPHPLFSVDWDSTAAFHLVVSLL